jgi:hypothetical protein
VARLRLMWNGGVDEGEVMNRKRLPDAMTLAANARDVSVAWTAGTQRAAEIRQNALREWWPELADALDRLAGVDRT